MNLNITIRNLAKKIENQNIFAASQEINGIKLFLNNLDFSELQQLYLSYLYFYNDIYTDLALKKVSEKVLDNFIREDSYAYYKKQKDPDKESEKKKQIHLLYKDPKGIKNLKLKRGK